MATPPPPLQPWSDISPGPEVAPLLWAVGAGGGDCVPAWPVHWRRYCSGAAPPAAGYGTERIVVRLCELCGVRNFWGPPQSSAHVGTIGAEATRRRAGHGAVEAAPGAPCCATAPSLCRDDSETECGMAWPVRTGLRREVDETECGMAWPAKPGSAGKNRTAPCPTGHAPAEGRLLVPGSTDWEVLCESGQRTGAMPPGCRCFVGAAASATREVAAPQAPAPPFPFPTSCRHGGLKPNCMQC
mmetsp:Transcript_120015/g.339592  ORF Transcript_120015/g.339592 Transcript_120015/m.339592 type:complete len:242 (-) Transcript_120015:2973-3698(-)